MEENEIHFISGRRKWKSILCMDGSQAMLACLSNNNRIGMKTLGQYVVKSLYGDSGITIFV
jgi:hypothetical protein